MSCKPDYADVYGHDGPAAIGPGCIDPARGSGVRGDIPGGGADERDQRDRLNPDHADVYSHDGPAAMGPGHSHPAWGSGVRGDRPDGAADERDQRD